MSPLPKWVVTRGWEISGIYLFSFSNPHMFSTISLFLSFPMILDSHVHFSACGTLRERPFQQILSQNHTSSARLYNFLYTSRFPSLWIICWTYYSHFYTHDSFIDFLNNEIRRLMCENHIYHWPYHIINLKISLFLWPSQIRLVSDHF